MKSVLDCGITGPLTDSDHGAVKLKLHIGHSLKRASKTPRQLLARLDFSGLRDIDGGINGTGENAAERAKVLQATRQNFSTAFLKALEEQPPYLKDSGAYPRMADALHRASLEEVPKKNRSDPGWFELAAGVLKPLITTRNNAMTKWMSSRKIGVFLSRKLAEARKQLRIAVANAKNEWVMQYVERMNLANARGGSKRGWDAVKVLRAGLVKTKHALGRMMKMDDGTYATTPEQNAEVFQRHFEKLYERQPTGDPSIIGTIPDHPVMAELGEEPDSTEVRKAVVKLRCTSPGKSGLHAAMFKALVECDEAFSVVCEVIIDIWRNEKTPDELDVGVLAILAKKGDLRLPGNYRGIMMLEVAYKIIALIASDRCYEICEKNIEHENQAGFRPGRGCTDGVFSVRQMLKKRREHGCETWCLFLDLVKAFDRVPREMLWKVIEKFGAPPKLIAILKALHAAVKVEFEVDGVTHTIDSIIGVKQGDVLGPVLFVLYMAAVMMSWRSQHNDKEKLCVFHSKPDSVMHGRSVKSGAAKDQFTVQDSEYADDTGLFFPSRAAIAEATPLVYVHFGLWGMEVHAGRAGEVAKTEALFCAAHPRCYANYATFDNVDLSPIAAGDGYVVAVVHKFKYLGSWLTTDCKDALDVDARVTSALKAFNALGRCVFRSKSVNVAAKRVVYNGLVLAILLYGSESWSMTEVLMNRLRVFQAACVRAMCRVTMHHVWEQRISTKDLEKQLGLQPIDVYLHRRQLAWAGHVSRMDWDVRIARKLLTSWCKAARPACGQEMTYARSLHKALKRAEIDVSSWRELAEDRSAWRAMIKNLK